MKKVIKNVSFLKEYESKFGILYSFKVEWDEGFGFYSSKKKEQTKFVKGQEAEFDVEEQKSGDKTWNKVKPVTNFKGNSNFGRALKREQSKYSGFAMSYAKDLVIADKIKLEDLSTYTRKMFQLMVDLDKTLEK